MPGTLGLFIGPDSRECGICRVIKGYDRFSPRGRRDDVTLYKSVCKSCCAERARAWYGSNTERGLTNRRRLQLAADYGITALDYDRRLLDQGSVCAICRKPETALRNGKVMRLSVDHHHDTGIVRGLLCNRCNRAIGMFGDRVDILKAAIAYLERE